MFIIQNDFLYRLERLNNNILDTLETFSNRPQSILRQEMLLKLSQQPLASLLSIIIITCLLYSNISEMYKLVTNIFIIISMMSKPCKSIPVQIHY